MISCIASFLTSFLRAYQMEEYQDDGETDDSRMAIDIVLSYIHHLQDTGN